MDHWAITSASGRRVSLLCDDTDYSYSSASSPSNSAPTPPLSPDHRRRPQRAYSMESSASSVSSGRSYTPPTPTSFGSHTLPTIEKLLPPPSGQYFPNYTSRSNSFSSPMVATIEENVIPATSQASSIATISNPPSPKSSSTASPVIKRSSRRYTCHCGKSFTTSGHLARHTRIHTGEKNYVCPEPECGARFSRQDNCMQHFRTHQSGSASKRAARRRRMSVDESVNKTGSMERTTSTIAAAPPHLHQRALSYPQPQHTYHSQTYNSAEGGLAALASVAIASYT